MRSGQAVNLTFLSPLQPCSIANQLAENGFDVYTRGSAPTPTTTGFEVTPHAYLIAAKDNL